MFILFLLSSVIFSGIINGPYIDNLSNNSAFLRFTTDKPTISWFGWGEFPKCDKYITFLPFKKDHTINLYGLKSDTKYCYSIFLPLENSTYSYVASSSTFSTFMDESKSTYSFVVYSNTALNTDEENKKIVSLILSSHTDINFVINLGNFLKKDNNDFIFPLEFGDIAKIFPIYTVLGSNEYKFFDGGLLLDEYRKMRGFSKNGVSPHYYYVDISNSRLIFLDGNPKIKNSLSLKKGSKQYNWLEEVLSFSKSKKWIFVLLNEPIYPSFNIEKNSDIEDLFIKYHVDFVFQNGENYLRTKKIKYGIESDDGIFYVNIGKIITDGSNQYNQIDDGTIDCLYNKKGLLKVSIEDKKILLDYLDLDGNFIDKFVYSK